MKITTYSGIGRRSNNEDYLIHSKGIYIVCDGVGGSEKGEVASRFVAETLLENCEGILDEPLNKTAIQQLIAETQRALNSRLLEKPEEIGMGTTLTMVSLKPSSVHIAHIGDSRVYFIRPSKAEYWHTKDHSLVQELVDAGIITETKARTHPKKNHITRAIQANSGGNVTVADIVKLNEIAEGDLLLLCSDGVMEAFDDHTLIKLLFRDDLSLESKLDIIKEGCANESSDNNTAILIEIEAGDAFSHGSNEEFKMRKLSTTAEIIEIDEIEPTSIQNSQNKEDDFVLQATDIEEQKKPALMSRLNLIKSRTKFLKWFFIVLISILGIFYLTTLFSGSEDKPDRKDSREKSVVDEKENTEDRKAFKLAQEANTTGAYEKYLKDYPNGSQKKSAEISLQKLRDEAAWKDAKSTNTAESYESYLKNYPEGKYTDEAKDSIKNIEEKNNEKPEHDDAGKTKPAKSPEIKKEKPDA